MDLEFHYIGLTEYQKAIEKMDMAIEEAIAQNKGFVIGLEHPLTYTAGVKTQREHILSSDIQVIPINRGGSVTLHNPGQLVVYFAIPLKFTPGLSTFVRWIEGSLIEVLWEYGVWAFQKKSVSGVFTSKGKIAFIGLGLKKQIIYHGLALNINNCLEDYEKIHSCGLKLPITRLCDLTREKADLNEVFEKICEKLKERFLKIKPKEWRDLLKKKLENLSLCFGAFRLGVLYFNEKRFWHAHEVWELAWHESQKNPLSQRDYQVFLQGLIQLAMAFYKYQNQKKEGFQSLLAKALNKLKNSRYYSLYFSSGEDLLKNLELYLKEKMPRKEYPFLVTQVDPVI